VIKVTFLPEGESIYTQYGTPLLEAARKAGIVINAPCGGEKECGKCKVFLISPGKPPLECLGCKLTLTEDSVVEVPLESRVSSEVKLIMSKKGGGEETGYGIALDLGTTTIVSALVGLESGDCLAQNFALNPQLAYGSDCISRISALDKDLSLLDILHQSTIDTINQLIEQLVIMAGVGKSEVREMVVAGNPTMEHIFLKLSPQSLGRAPYSPSFTSAQTLWAQEVGIDLEASLFLFPLITGWVGGDAVGLIAATELGRGSKPMLALDLGTNGELLLGCMERGILVTSVAAGPALEAVGIRHGMPAVKGAIESVQFEEGEVLLGIKDHDVPLGICGSGLIDAISEMVRHGIIHPEGKVRGGDELSQNEFAYRIGEGAEGRRFILYADGEREIFISQKDIRKVQLAKGAIGAGIEVLTAEFGIGSRDIHRVLISGSFGNHIRMEGLVETGIVPEELSDRVVFAEDAPLEGAKKALLSPKFKEEAQSIAEDSRWLDLSLHPDFQRRFLSALRFGKR
jgi:uncharacterized 2Fe-2S/4Fe-4S cluster protein (DUF4445 family)